MNVARFSFVADTAGGTQTIASGLGFTPKGYILYSVQATTQDAFAAHAATLLGFSDGTNSYCIGHVSENAAGTSDTGTVYGANVLRIQSTTAPDITTNAVANHSSFGSGTIAITWTQTPSAATRVMGIAFGGADISVETKAFTTGRTTTGQQNYTTLASQPDFGLFICPSSTAAVPNQAAHASTMIGCAVSSSKQFLIGVDDEDNQNNMDNWSYGDNTNCLGGWDRTTGAMDFLADFVSWLSNGFTLNYSNAPTSASSVFYGFFITGGDWDIGTVAKRTTTGTTPVTTATGSSNALKGVMLFSNCQQNSTTIRSHSRLSFGTGVSTTDEGGIWCGSVDAAGTSVAARYMNSTNIFFMATENATTASSVIEGLADLSAIGVDTFTLNYTTATAVAADIFWVVFAETPTTQNYNGNITETSITVSETIARILGALRPISETSITVNQTLERILGALRPISETSITVDQTISRLRTVPRTISEPTITSDETLTRLLAAIRSPTESTSINQALDRILAATRSIPESVSISEILDRILTSLRSISESAITVDETLARIFGAVRVPTESTSINQTIATLLAATRSIPESVSVSETLAKVYSTARTITEDGISINDSVLRLLEALRTISQNTTTDDSVTGTESAVAEINESAISINDSIIRLLSALRSPTEDAITIDQSVTATLIYLRTVNENAITISDALSTILGAIRNPTETYEISETLARLIQVTKSITEPSVNEDDAIIAIIGFLRTLSEDPINEDDSIVRLLGAIRSNSESAITVNETLSRLQTITKSISENPISIDQSIQALRATFANITEARIKWYYSLLVYKGGS